MFVLHSTLRHTMKKKFWVINKVNAFTAEVLLYGFIGEFEAIDDAAFITDLRTLENTYSTINIRVNCGGGDVYKGLTIFNAIRNSKATINGFVDGIAASMGAVIIAACNNVQMSKYARYMTHRVMGGSFGSADDMRVFADQLDELETIISKILAKRTGLSDDDAKAKYITDKDRWIGADQALQEKLIDGIYDADPVPVPANETNAQQLFNAFNKVYNIIQSNQTEMKEIALLLGLPENATETEIKVAIQKVQNEAKTLKDAALASAKARAKKLVDAAIANKQLLETDRQTFEALAENNFEAAEATIAKIPGVKKATEIIHGATAIVAESATDEIDSWEKLGQQSDEFVAKFRAEQPTKFQELHTAYLKKPVAATA